MTKIRLGIRKNSTALCDSARKAVLIYHEFFEVVYTCPPEPLAFANGDGTPYMGQFKKNHRYYRFVIKESLWIKISCRGPLTMNCYADK